MTAATVSTPTHPIAKRVRAVGVFARTVIGRAGGAVRQGKAALIGIAGLASISIGAGMVYLPAGFIVAGVLAVWYASRLPDGD